MGGSGFRRALKKAPIRDIFFFHVHRKIWFAGAVNQLTQRDQFNSSRLLCTIDHIRILGIELDRACNGGSCGGIY